MIDGFFLLINGDKISEDGPIKYVLSYAKLRNNQLTRIGKLTKI